MGLVDEIKELFGHHAATLQERMHGIENRLSDIRRASDSTARRLEYEILWQRFTIPAATLTFGEGGNFPLLTVPAGCVYQLVHWTWNAGEAERPVLLLNEQQNVISTNNESSQVMGAVSPPELLLTENSNLLAANRNKKQLTTIMLCFKVYRLGPPYQADVEASE